MRYKAVVSYDGSLFYGFQRLNEERTVQKEIEKALSIINKKDVKIKGASRTDKGVHAYGQVIHFDLDVVVPLDRLLKAVNRILPNDVRIVDIDSVDKDFHARHLAIGKKYVYRINLGTYSAFFNKYYLQYPYKIDIDKMKSTSKYFLGVHNFKNYTAGLRDNYTSKIDSIEFNFNSNILEITFVGKSFYRYMVRNMVGAMLDVARNKVRLSEIKSSIDNPNVEKRFSTASANGLYLMEVYYE